MNKFYIAAWILLVLATGVSYFTGFYNAATVVALSIIAVALACAPVVRSIFTDKPDMRVFYGNDGRRSEAGR